MGVHCCCLHVNYIVYKHFDKSLHVGSSDLTCVQNFRPVPLTVFEIQGFKLKKKNDNNKKLEKWTFCHISHVKGPIQTKYSVDIHVDLGYHLAVSKVDYDSANWNFRMYRHNGPRPRSHTKYYRTL